MDIYVIRQTTSCTLCFCFEKYILLLLVLLFLQKKMFSVLGVAHEFLKVYDLVLLFLQKKLFSILGVAHENPIFAQDGPKIGNF